MTPETLVTGLLWFLAFLFSTTVHEAMHAFVAFRGGDATAYHGGQVSLSPIPHIRREPIGMLVVPLLTALTQGWAIGWASTPYNAAWAAAYPRRAALMAASGPFGNLIVGAAALVLLRLGLASGWFASPEYVNFQHIVVAGDGGPSFAGTLLSILLTLNVLLAVFNLIPLPPLDGASVLGLFLPSETSRSLRQLSASPMFQLIGLVIAWRIFPMLVRPLFGFVLALVYPDLHYS